MQFPAPLTSPSCQMGLGATVHSRLGYDSALLPGCGQTRLQDWQNSSFKGPNQADLHSTEFPGQTAPPTCFWRWVKLLVGTTSWTLQVEAQSAKIQVLVAINCSPILHHDEIRNSWAPPITLWSLLGKTRVLGAPMKWPTMLGGLDITPGFFSCQRNQRLRRHLSKWCCATLGGCNVVSVQPATPLSFLVPSALASVVQGHFSLTPAF